MGKLGRHESLDITGSHLRYAVGYSLTSTWATVLLFSSFFSSAPAQSIVTTSMLSGVIACLCAIFLRPSKPLFDGRGTAPSVYATGAAVGTLLCTFPVLAQDAIVHDIGLAVSGFFTILLLLTWFGTFSRLPARQIVFLSGCAFLISAAGVFAILACPLEIASIATSLLPIASYSLLPRPAGTNGSPTPTRTSIHRVLAEAVPWKTLLGIAISFYVIGSVGTLAPGLGALVELSPVYLAIPAALCALFVLSALASPRHVDGSVLFKLLLIAVAAIAFLLVYAGSANLSLVFFLYITADVLLWCVLALAARKTPVEPYLVFATGWLAECAGNVLGHNVTAAMGNTPLLFAVVMLLVLVAVGFAFGDGFFVLDLDGEDDGEGRAPGGVGQAGRDPSITASHDREGLALGARDPLGGSPASTAPVASDMCAGLTSGDPAGGNPTASGGDGAAARLPGDAVASFAGRYGLSQRETDVFALWVTGHGLKYIQDTLFISESTVKTHLRSIYRKCGAHNRAEIIALFEE